MPLERLGVLGELLLASPALTLLKAQHQLQWSDALSAGSIRAGTSLEERRHCIHWDLGPHS